MWPKRKILLLVPQDRQGWQGILSLLNALQRDVIVRETSSAGGAHRAEEAVSGPEAALGEGVIPGPKEALCDRAEAGPTEILYWPGIPQEEPYRQRGLARGLLQREVREFLHRYWEEEIILPVKPGPEEEEPFLWRILDEAGYEPSLLWQTREGRWEVRIRNGLHWIVPESWLAECWAGEKFGRRPPGILLESCWVRQGERVEFYGDKERLAYLGAVRSGGNKVPDDALYAAMLQALRLGVPWESIRRASDGMNIRWYADDLAKDEGTGGAPVPSVETEYLAYRGAG